VSLYRLIDEERDRQSVFRLCRALGVTRSGFYDWQRQLLSDRALADWLLTEQIRAIFSESEQTLRLPAGVRGADARPRCPDRRKACHSADAAGRLGASGFLRMHDQ